MELAVVHEPIMTWVKAVVGLRCALGEALDGSPHVVYIEGRELAGLLLLRGEQPRWLGLVRYLPNTAETSCLVLQQDRGLPRSLALKVHCLRLPNRLLFGPTVGPPHRA